LGKGVNMAYGTGMYKKSSKKVKKTKKKTMKKKKK